MSKRKANIRLDLIGELFLKPGEDIPYRLILCNTEPTAVIQRVDNAEPESPTGISGLSGLILLKPVRPIEKPRRPRADSGKTHKKARERTGIRGAKPLSKVPSPLEGEGEQEDEPELVDKRSDNLYIHVPTGLDGDTEYKVNIAGSEIIALESVGLRTVILKALEQWDGKIPDVLNEQARGTIQGILDAGK